MTIAVFGVLLAVVTPSLLWTRRSGERVRCLMNVRACAAAFALYTNDHEDAYPFLGEPRWIDAINNGGVWAGFTAHEWIWGIGLKEYLSRPGLAPEQLCPSGSLHRNLFGRNPEPGVVTLGTVGPADYLMSLTLVTDPSLWSDDAQWRENRFLRVVRVQEVVHPSLKGILLERFAYHDAGRVDHRAEEASIDHEHNDLMHGAAFADGHAVHHRRHDFRSGLVPGNPNIKTPVLYTRQGVRGRDTGS